MRGSRRERFGVWLWLALWWAGAAGVAGEPARPRAAMPAAVTNDLAREIVRDLHPDGLRQAHVLAFKSQVDDRPLRVESALVAVELGRGRWELWHVARNPGADAKRSVWSPYSITDSTQRGWKSFDHRPTEKEVDAFLGLSCWTFGAEPPFRLVGGEVFKAGWKAALGFEPGHSFPTP